MKKRIASMLLAAAAVLGLCTPALAAPAKSARCWKVYVEHSSIYWQGSKAAEPDAKAPVWQPAWLPEGWTLEYGAARDGVWPETNWVYRCGVSVPLPISASASGWTLRTGRQRKRN